MSSLKAAVNGFGFSDPSQSKVLQHFEDLHQSHLQDPIPDESWVLFVPGRIEWLGKHTDYAGGASLISALENGFYALIQRSDSPELKIRELGSDRAASWDLNNGNLIQSEGESRWLIYPQTVIKRILLNFKQKLSGVQITFKSDLPEASGMSSSSALMIMIFLAIAQVNDLPRSSEFTKNIINLNDLALYLACIENGSSFKDLEGERGVGTFGGSEDHTAILKGKSDHLHHFGYGPLQENLSVRLPKDYRLALATCGIQAEKTQEALEKYNELSLLTQRAVQLWNEHSSLKVKQLEEIRIQDSSSRKTLNSYFKSELNRGRLKERTQHFYTEMQLLNPSHWIRDGQLDVQLFSLVANLSHEGAVELLKNQIPETAYLARAATQVGATGASAFGAGFGGSVWALFNSGEAQVGLKRWKEIYSQKFPEAAEKAKFFLSHPGPGAGFV